MEIDKTTLSDLAIFEKEDEFSIFSKINFTVTGRGKDQLRNFLSSPLSDIDSIQKIQKTILLIRERRNEWPVIISNGTLLVVERFYNTNIDPIPAAPNPASAYSYKLLHNYDFTFVKYSVRHCFDFIKGMQQSVRCFLNEDTPLPFKKLLEEARQMLDKPQLKIIYDTKLAAELTGSQMLGLAHFLRYGYKTNMFYLLTILGKMDAWYGMALAVDNYNLVMPEFTESDKPVFKAEGLYHLMLQEPVSYNLKLDRTKNFLFLTGANMAGKSTFIKACGTACYLAHIGMGVPAKKMQISCFDGLLSNINVIDNIAKGESYFFNEVQRIKATIQKVGTGKKWLILTDELFKGTNVQDAMKCSNAVIEGLVNVTESLFILSTHLYEIGEELKKYPNISFNYFETSVEGEQLSFSYQLKEGISNDRLGYLIMKKEGVVKMLDELK